jgi:TonB family protein
MYLDLQDYRPDTPRVPSAISRREGVLLSLVAHAVLLLVILFAPTDWLEATPLDEARLDRQEEPLRFVEMAPLVDRMELARKLAEQSDQDRRSATIERAPVPENEAPRSLGNTPEKVEGGPDEAPAPEPPPAPPPPAPSAESMVALGPEPPPAPAPAPPAPTAGRALRNLQRYLRNENYDNPEGGATDQSADIQFDAKGVDFGPWLRRFRAQIRRNWLIPQVAELARGRVVVQFFVLRNGSLIELQVVRPAGIGALTSAAVNALKLSNPTLPLPEEYPDDRILFTVTFLYNEPYDP